MHSSSIVTVAGRGSLVACSALSSLVAVLGLLDHASTVAPTQAVEPATASAPLVIAAAPAPVPAPVAPPIARKVRVTAPRDSLCAPRTPLDQDTEDPSLPPLHPKRYAAWLRTRTPQQRKRIAAHCRAHPLDYDRLCGGIGPLHIPLQPCIMSIMQPYDGMPMLPASPYATHKEWEAALTPAQRRYIERNCPHSESRPSSDLCGLNTPLVVAFANQPIEFSTGGRFAFAPGIPSASDFPTAATPWLALDRDHDGAIESGAELFGSNTRLADGTTALNGFVALAELDANHDGRIDAGDPAFHSLVLWADRDQNRRSDPGELQPADSVIVSISLQHHVELRCDARSNCEGERATILWRDASGATHEGSLVDVYLPRR
jgi:hypothetical protein